MQLLHLASAAANDGSHLRLLPSPLGKARVLRHAERSPHRMRILIAEDDFASRILLEAVLIKWGYDVVLAHDGEQAWQALQTEAAPAIAIVDWMMPLCSGVDLCRKVRGQPRELVPYILMLTAKGQKADITEGLDAGADDYLVKPFDLAELGARLRVARRSIALQSELLDSRRAVAYQALHDVSTGALNRGNALDSLSAALSADSRLTVMLAALDGHRELQHQHGAPYAEAAMRGLVRSVRSIAPSAIIGRYSADELLVVLPGQVQEEGVAIAEEVRAKVANRELSAQVGLDGKLSVSIGVAEWDGAVTMEVLLCYADAALYAARARGDAVDAFSMHSIRPSAE